MSTLFISDLHLEDRRPECLEQFLGFLSEQARGADALYILGDLFEFWIGDDALSDTARRVAAATAALTATGVPCFFMHGNRDFLLGERYAALAGMELLPESCVVDLYGTPTLLLHGDTLCTDDVEYQAFRTQSRSPRWQEMVLAMSVDQRMELARNARDASRRHTGSVDMDIMDVNEEAVLETFRQEGVTRMIHGHTHRPAFHRHELEDGTVARRIVLSDWYARGSYLEVSSAAAVAVEL